VNARRIDFVGEIEFFCQGKAYPFSLRSVAKSGVVDFDAISHVNLLWFVHDVPADSPEAKNRQVAKNEKTRPRSDRGGLEEPNFALSAGILPRADSGKVCADNANNDVDCFVHGRPLWENVFGITGVETVGS